MSKGVKASYREGRREESVRERVGGRDRRTLTHSPTHSHITPSLT